MKAKQKFWIKERHNPQLGTYYVAVGQMSKWAASRMEYSLHGSNTMHSFDTEAEYQARIKELRESGKRVHQ